VDPSHVKTKSQFVISPFVASTFFSTSIASSSIVSITIQWGDDMLTAMHYAYRGYYSYVVPDIIGVHYIEFTKKRSSLKKAYYFHRNNVFNNFASSGNKYLFYVITSIYELFVWTPLSLAELKKYIKKNYVLS